MERWGYNVAVDNITTSFYFSDFPDDWKVSDMWKSFRPFGTIVDVFVPTKRDKNGRRFGFVRYKGIRDTESLENSLKALWIGEQNIFIKLARFRRPNGSGGIKTPELRGPQEHHTTLTGATGAPPRLCDGNSYLRVLTDNTRPLGQLGNGDNLVTTKRIVAKDIKDEELKLLSRCAIGNVKTTNFLANLPFLLKEGGFLAIRAMYLGGFRYLLERESADEMTKML